MLLDDVCYLASLKCPAQVLFMTREVRSVHHVETDITASVSQRQTVMHLMCDTVTVSDHQTGTHHVSHNSLAFLDYFLSEDSSVKTHTGRALLEVNRRGRRW